MGRMFANGPGDLGSILGRVIPKTLKMVPDMSLQYKVRIKGKVEQSIGQIFYTTFEKKELLK